MCSQSWGMQTSSLSYYIIASTPLIRTDTCLKLCISTNAQVCNRDETTFSQTILPRPIDNSPSLWLPCSFYLKSPVTTLSLWFLLISSAPWVTIESVTEVQWMGGLNLSYNASLTLLMELPSEWPSFEWRFHIQHMKWKTTGTTLLKCFCM